MSKQHADFFLSKVKTGDIMLLSVSSQCEYTVTVVLKDDRETYFTANNRTGEEPIRCLLQESTLYRGGGKLRIEVDVSNSQLEIESKINSNDIVDTKMNPVGCIYTMCIELDKDERYEDIYIDFVAWNKKG